MKDTGVCPHCRREFEVERYGWGIPCPHCRRRVNVFPDPQVFIHTKLGVCGIGLVKPEILPKAVEIVPKSRFFKGVLKLLPWR